MAIVKVKDNNQWIIPRTYVNISGVWVPVDNSYIQIAGSFDNELIIYVTVTTTNLDVAALFEATYPGSWAKNTRKRLIINTGVIIGSTDVLNRALIIAGTGFGGRLTLDNYGSIQGAGGIYSTSSAFPSPGAQRGGAAIYTIRSLTINNFGTIYGGGGAGGTGGRGGTGTPTSPPPGAGNDPFPERGFGGIGGRGQGYDGSATTGSPGLPGYNGGGTGGTGGTGGSWGATGQNGFNGTSGTTGAAFFETTQFGERGGQYLLVGSSGVIVTWNVTGTRLGNQGI